ncbi:MAG: hypothetical protein ACPGVO_18785 [Spirulinaceae cyanobacterium]
MTFLPSPEVALPMIPLSDRTPFHFNSQTIAAFPGEMAQTDGDIVIHFPAVRNCDRQDDSLGQVQANQINRFNSALLSLEYWVYTKCGVLEIS